MPVHCQLFEINAFEDTSENNSSFSCQLFFHHLIFCVSSGYLFPFSKNDVISSVRKHYCALGVRVRFRVGAWVSGNTFSVKRVLSSVVEPQFRLELPNC